MISGIETSALALLGGEPVLTRSLAAWPVFDDAEREGLRQVLESGVWGGYSPAVKVFESAFAEAHDCQYGISLANGTLSLEAALLACDIGPGDEVIVPPITFAATATAVLRVGAVPVFSDIEGTSFNLDPLLLEEAITPRTKAIIPVHFAGYPANMDELLRIAQQHGLILIEDCAHAHGAVSGGQHAGTAGTWGAFSFYPTKNLGAKGDAGALITNSEEISIRTKSLRNYGTTKRYEHPETGLNSRLDEVQAAILSTRLNWLERFNARRREIAQKYFDKIDNVRIELLSPPVEDENHVYHLFVVRCAERNRLAHFLEERGIETLIHYPIPAHRQGCCKNVRTDPRGLANAELHAEQLSRAGVDHDRLSAHQIGNVIAVEQRCLRILEPIQKLRSQRRPGYGSRDHRPPNRRRDGISQVPPQAEIQSSGDHVCHPLEHRVRVKPMALELEVVGKGHRNLEGGNDAEL